MFRYDQGYKQSGWGDEVDITRKLETIRRDVLYPNYHASRATRYLADLVYAEYGHRQIGFQHASVFVKKFTNQHNKTWRQVFAKLYRSVDVISNPFQTDNLYDDGSNLDYTESSAFGRLEERRDNTQTTVTNEHSTSTEQRYNAQDGYSTNQQLLTEQGMSTTSSADKSIEDKSHTDTDLFADTPQVTNPAATVWDGKAGDAPVLWAEGQTTTANVAVAKDHTQNVANSLQGAADARQSDGENKTLYGSQGDGHVEGANNQTTGAITSGSNSHVLNTHDTNGVRVTGLKKNLRKGFTGMSVSAMLAEWRETFISVDAEYVAQFEDLFLQVW